MRLSRVRMWSRPSLCFWPEKQGVNRILWESREFPLAETSASSRCLYDTQFWLFGNSHWVVEENLMSVVYGSLAENFHEVVHPIVWSNVVRDTKSRTQVFFRKSRTLVSSQMFCCSSEVPLEKIQLFSSSELSFGCAHKKNSQSFSYFLELSAAPVWKYICVPRISGVRR